MSASRYYYISEEAKTIMHFAQHNDALSEDFLFAGMSQLPVKGAVAFFGKNQPGYTVTDGDSQPSETQDHEKRVDVPAD